LFRYFWLPCLGAFLAPLLLLSSGSLLFAGSEDKKEEPSREEKLKKAYPKKIKDSHLLKGLLPLRKKEGKLFAEISSEDLQKRYLLLSSISRGFGEGGFQSGMMAMGQEVVLGFKEVEDRILVMAKNVRFKAKQNSPEAEAVALSYSDSVIASLKVRGLAPDGKRLVLLDGFFFSDLLGLTSDLGQTLGHVYSQDLGATRWVSAKAFPENLELRVSMAFHSSQGGSDQDNLPDSRRVQVGVHYSLLSLPEKGYKPRLADDRVGYFLRALKDLSRQDIEGPTVRYINRWNLEKADPDADRSPVKEPIVYYLCRNVPYRWRPYLRAGILEWNKAFAKIGLLDAVEVRYQGPKDDWDPEDVRYNTVSWVLGNVPFGAIGPSHHNPVTGEILDADVLFSGAMVRGFWQEAQLNGLGEGKPTNFQALAEKQFRIWKSRQHQGPRQLATRNRRPGCSLGSFMEHEFAVAAASYLAQAGETKGKDGEAAVKSGKLPEAFIGAALKWVIMHEVGHTLGLRHNFKASTVVPLAKLHDAVYTREHGLLGSVMDYPASNLAAEGRPQGEYFASTLGPYDYWAIAYGYKAVKKPEELAAMAARSAEPLLAYASDEDRIPMMALQIDPLSQAGDLGADPLAFAEQRLEQVRLLREKLLERVVPEGGSYLAARRAVQSLLFSTYRLGNIASVYIGGQYHHRDHRGDPAERPAFSPVPAAVQRRALRFLARGVFSDRSFEFSPDVLKRLAPDHWWHWGNLQNITSSRIDFPHHRIVSAIQRMVLMRILDPWLLDRMLDQERSTPDDQDLLGVGELLTFLSTELFSELKVLASEKKWTVRAPYISSFRRNLQRSYLELLGHLALHLSSAWSSDAGGLARAQLRTLRGRLSGSLKDSLDLLSRAHLQDLLARTDEILTAEKTLSGF
jgi:hypothetical protein